MGAYSFVTLPLGLQVTLTVESSFSPKSTQSGRGVHDDTAAFAAYGVQDRSATPRHDRHAAPQHDRLHDR
jgi:hypothetical protein